MKHVQVLVVGAGPAGSVAAARLGALGKEVLLVDRARFPREKVCGGCLQPVALRALEAGGLRGAVERCGAIPLRAMELHAGGATATLPLAGGMAVSRRTLDAALVEEARARGAAFRDGVRARLGGTSPGSRGREVILEAPDGDVDSVRADIVLDASGLSGGLLGSARPRRGSFLGAGVVLEWAEGKEGKEAESGALAEGVVRMASGRGGYVGAVRAEGGRLILAAALAPSLVARTGGLGAASGSILRACGLPPPHANAPWRGTPLLTRRPVRVWDDRVLVLGDAAGYVEPFTGEGMAWAMRSALAAADLAALGWTGDTGPRWETLHGRIVGTRQRRCRALTLLLRVPPLVHAAVTVLGVAPRFAAPLVRAAAAGGLS
jgi:flavin-dependent dehydrogenase